MVDFTKMADLVEKLQLQLDEVLLHLEPIGLREICKVTGVQEPEYEGKTKRQLINGKVDTLIKNENKIELLNIIGK